MKRGEIYYANLDSTVGSEIAKRRHVLIVSNDANNRSVNTVPNYCKTLDSEDYCWSFKRGCYGDG